VNQGALRARDEEQERLAPILGNEKAVERLVQTLVKTTSLSGENPARTPRDSEQSDRFEQAELEASSGGDLGKHLDVTA
jgi:hypothetical protein